MPDRTFLRKCVVSDLPLSFREKIPIYSNCFCIEATTNDSVTNELTMKRAIVVASGLLHWVVEIYDGHGGFSMTHRLADRLYVDSHKTEAGVPTLKVGFPAPFDLMGDMPVVRSLHDDFNTGLLDELKFAIVSS